MASPARRDTRQLADLLRRQNHVIGRSQALACGLTPAGLMHRIRAGGPWQRLLPGVYLAVTGAVTSEHREMATLLYAGPWSVLTGAAAARRHGISIEDRYRVEVLVPAHVRRLSSGFVQIQRTTRMPEQVCTVGEIRFAMPGRAVAS